MSRCSDRKDASYKWRHVSEAGRRGCRTWDEGGREGSSARGCPGPRPGLGLWAVSAGGAARGESGAVQSVGFWPSLAAGDTTVCFLAGETGSASSRGLRPARRPWVSPGSGGSDGAAGSLSPNTKGLAAPQERASGPCGTVTGHAGSWPRRSRAGGPGTVGRGTSLFATRASPNVRRSWSRRHPVPGAVSGEQLPSARPSQAGPGRWPTGRLGAPGRAGYGAPRSAWCPVPGPAASRLAQTHTVLPAPAERRVRARP